MLLDDEDDRGAEKIERDEVPEKDRSRGVLALRDGAEPEKDREGNREEKPRLVGLDESPRDRLSP